MDDDNLVNMDLIVNGERVSRVVKGGRRLLDFLRDDLHLTGSKEGCGEGECGSCTVLLDTHSVLACLTPMERAIGRSVVTIEGVGSPTNLHPIQAVLLDEGGVQCGMCTPGMVISAIDLLQHNPDPTLDEIIEGISGNLCRCTGYKKIIFGIQHAAQELRASSEAAEPVKEAVK
jgi:aerobic-type carbon monoxide dehydrogenase small subunit (CoxS/CutS family)